MRDVRHTEERTWQDADTPERYTTEAPRNPLDSIMPRVLDSSTGHQESTMPKSAEQARRQRANRAARKQAAFAARQAAENSGGRPHVFVQGLTVFGRCACGKYLADGVHAVKS